MRISSDEAWLVLRKYAEGDTVVLASIVEEDALVFSLLGRLNVADDRCLVSSIDGVSKCALNRRILFDAEYVDPREAPPPLAGLIASETLDSGLRLNLGVNRWGFILHLKPGQTR